MAFGSVTGGADDQFDRDAVSTVEFGVEVVDHGLGGFGDLGEREQFLSLSDQTDFDRIGYRLFCRRFIYSGFLFFFGGGLILGLSRRTVARQVGCAIALIVVAAG